MSLKPKTATLIQLLPFFAPYRKKVLAAGIALLVTALMVLFFGKALKYLIDYGFVRQDKEFLNIVLLIFFVAVILMSVAGYLRSFMINSVAERVIADLRNKVYHHIIQVSAQYFEIHKTGDVISRLTVDTVVLYNIISTTISFFLRNLILFVGGIMFLFLTNVKLSIISLGLIPFAISPIIMMGRRIKSLSSKSQEAIANMGSHIEETVNGVKTVQSFLCEDREVSNFASFVDRTLNIALSKIRYKSLLIASVITLAFGSVGIVLWVGGNQVLSGDMTPGELSSFIFYSIVASTSLVSLSQIAGQLQTASAATARVFEILDVKSPVLEDKSQSQPITAKKININFNAVNFAYPTRQESQIISDFTLEIKQGDKISFVGSSGCGKSTLLQLLLRFYDVKSGSITINGHDIKSLSLKDLRQNFSYISQDPFIFSGTIYDNITYGDQSISELEVRKMIDKNKALAFIKDFPNGINSFVGEKGIKLSGGEKQRIAIARALVKDSPILLLDEATSALDNQNESLVNEMIAGLAKGKTVISVAHKLSSVAQSDKIFFIKSGKIVESGSHQELIKKNGLYKKMYEVEMLD